ncbi:hypothetical protein MLP_42520 [Microlunatus phosphovorus NM-1]|uniref:Uncharacterized protein n=1 Tax=Microlunatus phosphovorus (strain ATCC 700054 / DSM 10555 / JCM 9379 / NBRC 101784 / NCIMB 13414 / VKM Ac-1990 / NM-1) TaxID=1032480 RepID=F5XSK8_MICPN|nr:hypothetical protein [Microlunatus phosphovorus]BAK37266.1 hypothetical protein MLP_42520 [Microlunatus phosphovorus NM-1]
MAEDTIVFPDLSLMEQIDALLPALGFPASTEVEVEPALDYPGQQLAIDIYAPTDGELHTAVEAIRDALFLKFRIATRTSSELDREILAKQSA